MIRGTTSLFRFKVPYPKSELAWATAKFWQPNNPNDLLPIFKTLEHCNLPDNSYELCFSLTAEETARFLDTYKGSAQLRAQHAPSGAVFGMKPYTFVVYPMDDEILDANPTLPPANEENFVVLNGGEISS